jgi:hypothetical protein
VVSVRTTPVVDDRRDRFGIVVSRRCVMEDGSLEKSRGSEFLDRDQLWIAIDDQLSGLALVSGRASFLSTIFTGVDEKYAFHLNEKRE